MEQKDLILVRSDEGDGGWSLHSTKQIADAKAHNDAPEYLAAGPAQWDELLNHGYGDWNRPNGHDYAEALSNVGAAA